MSKISMNPVNRPRKPDVQKGLNAVASDLKYRYNLFINKRLMGKYMALCRERGVSVPSQITAFVERELKRYDDQVPDDK